MRKPDFLCIGAQKAGTTWFHQVFGGRSDVWVPPIKEIHFFDHIYGADTAQWSAGHIRRAVKQSLRHHITSAPDIALDYVAYLVSLTREDMFSKKWYFRVWERAGANQHPLDVTPEYSTISDEGVAYVKRLLPEARFLYILRDPAERAASQIRMNAARRNMKPATVDEWLKEVERAEVDHRGDYKTYIPRWKKAYKEDQLLFQPYGLIGQAPAVLLKRCEAFFDLPPSEYPKLFDRIHGGQGAKVPDEVKDILRQRYAEQYKFLADAFPQSFLEYL